MKKTFWILVCVIMIITLSACGLTAEKEQEIAKNISWQCDHIASLSFDGTNSATTESTYNTEENTYTLYIINSNVTEEDMQKLEWQENGKVILNLENSINELCSSMKSVFDESELKTENYDVIIHFTDKSKKTYFTSTNGITTYSEWGR
ncbi:MAG: hypothetical protein IJN94_05875 [Clostridia bacterium]|nr:hypothetical protein [Clostridia bacterium]